MSEWFEENVVGLFIGLVIGVILASLFWPWWIYSVWECAGRR